MADSCQTAVVFLLLLLLIVRVYLFVVIGFGSGNGASLVVVVVVVYVGVIVVLAVMVVILSVAVAVIAFIQPTKGVVQTQFKSKYEGNNTTVFFIQNGKCLNLSVFSQCLIIKEFPAEIRTSNFP